MIYRITEFQVRQGSSFCKSSDGVRTRKYCVPIDAIYSSGKSRVCRSRWSRPRPLIDLAHTYTLETVDHFEPSIRMVRSTGRDETNNASRSIKVDSHQSNHVFLFGAFPYLIFSTVFDKALLGYTYHQSKLHHPDTSQNFQETTNELRFFGQSICILKPPALPATFC